MIGYWLAAAVIDNPRVGRLRLQLLGFAAVCILFYVAAAVYPRLASKKGLPTFQFIYFFSSFWGQFGPNCTTFLLAGKLSCQVLSTSVLAVMADVLLLCVLAQQLCNARPYILGWSDAVHACTDTCIAIHGTTCYITNYHMLYYILLLYLLVLYMLVLTLELTYAGELYPTEVRTTAHGMSAGVAKMGALWATIWFNYSPLTVARSVM